MNRINFIGEIKPIKDTDKFKGYEEKDFESGWQTEKLRYNMICGDNRHLVELSAGGWKDTNKNVIYTVSAGENGKRGTKIQVKWADRFNPEVVDNVADFRKYVVDLNPYGALQEAKESGNEDAIEVCKKKRKEFISELDMVKYLLKMINSDKISGMNFKTQGDIVYSYSPSKNQFYRSFVVQKVYRAADDAKPSSAGTMDIFFGAGCVDDSMFEEKKKYYVSGYTQFYEKSTFKRNIFVPVTLVIDANGDEKAVQLANGLKRVFEKAENDEIRKICVNVEFLDGAQRVEISEDMLSDDQKKNIADGLTTLDNIRREMGGSVFGDRVIETRIIGLARGFSGGSVETAYSASTDMTLPVFEQEIKQKNTPNNFDIFNDDDLDI